MKTLHPRPAGAPRRARARARRRPRAATTTRAPAARAASGDDRRARGRAARPSRSDAANAGKTFTVGSKNFAEQYILGEIYAQSLEAAGFTVKKQLDLGSEQIAFKSLKDGTHRRLPRVHRHGADVVLPRQDRRRPARPGRVVRPAQERGCEADNITALPQTPFQNTFVITSTKETAEKLGNPKTITELAEKAGSKMSISGFPECRQRTDCLLGLKNVYDWKPKFVSSPGQVRRPRPGPGRLHVRLRHRRRAVARQVRHVRGRQAAVPAVLHHLHGRATTGIEKLGDGGQEVIEKVQEPLTEEVMQELNSRVTIDKQEPEAVAADYLKEAGFVE